MRLLCTALLACWLVGCNVDSNSSSEETHTNPDGSTTTIKTKTWSKNGVSGGEKTETTLGRDGKLSIATYEKKNGEWVKK